MKQILISIQPKWVAKILNGDKTIEIRKTMPKCELPCKVYIYCTKEKSYLDRLVQNHNGYYYTVGELVDFDADDYGLYYDVAGKNGQVVAEFILNKVTEHKKNFIDFEDNECYNFKVCDVKNAGFDTDVLSLCDFDNFVESYGKGKPLYAWHIDDLKIYDEPKELSEFRTTGHCFNNKNITIKQNCCGDYVGNYNENSFCRICKYYDSDFGDCSKTILQLKRPPQSWCYVMEACND